METMNKVEQLECELQKLSAAELRQVRDWLDNFVPKTNDVHARVRNPLLSHQNVK